MSMPTCPSCIYAQGICEKTGVKIRYSTGCTYYNTKPMTNADRIRNMTDEELAEWVAEQGVDCAYCRIESLCYEECKYGDCKNAWLEWLKQEISNDE